MATFDMQYRRLPKDEWIAQVGMRLGFSDIPDDVRMRLDYLYTVGYSVEGAAQNMRDYLRYR